MTSEALIRTARSYDGQRESAPNSSPLIDHWLAGVGCAPGAPWCAAFAVACVRETDPTIADFHPSASALKLLEHNPDREVFIPAQGDLVVWDHGNGKGHVAIITEIADAMTFSAIAGNTSEDGHSREGVMVKEHDGFLFSDPQIAGFVRVCKS